MRTLVVLLGLLNPPEYRVYYQHPDNSWEHLGAWFRLADVPGEWRGRAEFVIIREQRIQ